MPDLLPICVAALYRFSRFEDCAAIRQRLDAAGRHADLRGTLIVASEGINGTIAGSDDAIAAMLDAIRALPGCADLQPRLSRAATMPFDRWKVRIKPEIVTLGAGELDPANRAGTYVPPREWNALIRDPATLVIDTRNHYEVAVGTFTGAVDPETRSFREFPAWFRANRERLMAGKRQVAMFCTGGIRCEKSTAFLKGEGVERVHHLQGGVLAYLDSVDPAQSLFHGECFVFDQRVALGPALAPGSTRICSACGMPDPCRCDQG